MIIKANKNPLNSENLKYESLNKSVEKILKNGVPVLIYGDTIGRTQITESLGECIRISIFDLITVEEKEKVKIRYNVCKKLVRRSIMIESEDQYNMIVGEVSALNKSSITLKTTDMESQFDIGIEMWKAIQTEGITVGSVIKLYRDYGIVKNVGFVATSLMDPVDGVQIFQEGVPTKELICTESIKVKLSLDEVGILNYTQQEDNLEYSSGIFVPEYLEEEVDYKISKMIAEEKIVETKKTIIIDLINFDNSSLISDIAEVLLKHKAIPLFISNKKISLSNLITISLPKFPNEEMRLYLTKIFKSKNVQIDENILNKLSEMYEQLDDINYIVNIALFSIKDNKVSEDLLLKYTNSSNPIHHFK